MTRSAFLSKINGSREKIMPLKTSQALLEKGLTTK
ncbi:hypothetical protein RJ639_016276 [Escallonia herrerae]|uniref:Uncharacterized protein n=1 Tax=Escallonia herrerae TaxID=1293975 RepID=A0AA88VF85_9ASTE|nr:hypothetical protein RJ639_016276 [Escallonia herrerae]